MRMLLHPVGNTFTNKIETHSMMTKGKDNLIHSAEAANGSRFLCLLSPET